MAPAPPLFIALAGEACQPSGVQMEWLHNVYGNPSVPHQLADDVVQDVFTLAVLDITLTADAAPVPTRDPDANPDTDGAGPSVEPKARAGVLLERQVTSGTAGSAAQDTRLCMLEHANVYLTPFGVYKWRQLLLASTAKAPLNELPAWLPRPTLYLRTSPFRVGLYTAPALRVAQFLSDCRLAQPGKLRTVAAKVPPQRRLPHPSPTQCIHISLPDSCTGVAGTGVTDRPVWVHPRTSRHGPGPVGGPPANLSLVHTVFEGRITLVLATCWCCVSRR
jgi:hypothetical protein